MTREVTYALIISGVQLQAMLNWTVSLGKSYGTRLGAELITAQFSVLMKTADRRDEDWLLRSRFRDMGRVLLSGAPNDRTAGRLLCELRSPKELTIDKFFNQFQPLQQRTYTAEEVCGVYQYCGDFYEENG